MTSIPGIMFCLNVVRYLLCVRYVVSCASVSEFLLVCVFVENLNTFSQLGFFILTYKSFISDFFGKFEMLMSFDAKVISTDYAGPTFLNEMIKLVCQ